MIFIIFLALTATYYKHTNFTLETTSRNDIFGKEITMDFSFKPWEEYGLKIVLPPIYVDNHVNKTCHLNTKLNK